MFIRSARYDTNAVRLKLLFSMIKSRILKLHIDICVIMSDHVGAKWTDNYGIDGVPLTFVSSHRDQGLLVDVKLKFHDHVRIVVRNAGGMIVELLWITIINHQCVFVLLLWHPYMFLVLDLLWTFVHVHVFGMWYI